jgi:hypothetical protein
MSRTRVGAPAVAVGLAGLLTGNELGTLAAVHPAVARLPMPALLLAEQELTSRYRVLMPPLMTTTVTACLAAAGMSTGPRRRLLGAAAASYAAMLAVTLTGNVPLNAATLGLPATATADQVRGLRQRWDRLHRRRVALDLIGLGLAAVAVAIPTSSEPKP